MSSWLNLIIILQCSALALLTGQNRNPAQQQTHEMTVPNELIGCIIGKGGSKVAEIRWVEIMQEIMLLVPSVLISSNNICAVFPMNYWHFHSLQIECIKHVKIKGLNFYCYKCQKHLLTSSLISHHTGNLFSSFLFFFYLKLKS